jgi:hypothetical protein
MSESKTAAAAPRIKLGSTIEKQTKVTGLVTSPTSILVRYETLPNNQPGPNGNAIAVWQDTQIPYGGTPPPVQKKTTTGVSPHGSDAFDNLDLQKKPYIVGYSTGSNLNTICSTLLFTPGNPEGTPFLTSVKATEVATDTLIIKFDTPLGNDPKTNQNWIGLWEGQSFTWDGKNRKAKVAVNKTNASDSQPLTHSLKFDTWYTVVYASGPADTDIAAVYTFKTDPFMSDTESSEGGS